MRQRFTETELRVERLHQEESDSVEQGIRDDGDLYELASYQYGRDYDRLLYSSAFRKLGGVTQVVTSEELSVFHNRLTHSLKVAQTAGLITAGIARNANRQNQGVIRTYGGLHPSVVRAACLAHDIGHPPFGHIGEQALQRILDDPAAFLSRPERPVSSAKFPTIGQESFEGNAQSFRVVTRLAFRDASTTLDGPNQALNLTRATLAAISKYPWTSTSSRRLDKGNKWGAYSTEADLLAEAMRLVPADRPPRIINGVEIEETRSIEAQVMDWADDISYAVHDAEDFFRAGLIPLDEIGAQGREAESFIQYAVDSLHAKKKLPSNYTKEKVFDLLAGRDGGETVDVFGTFPESKYDGSLESRTVLHRMASALIKAATTEVSIDADGILVANEWIYVVIEVLKKLTERYVTRRPALGSAQRGQSQALIELVTALYHWKIDSLGIEAAGQGGAIRVRGQELPARFEDYYDLNDLISADEATLEERVLRTVVDYVASLTDSQALAFHGRLVGGGRASMLEPWLFL